MLNMDWLNDDLGDIGVSWIKGCKMKGLRLQGSNFRLGGIALNIRTVPSFPVRFFWCMDYDFLDK